MKYANFETPTQLRFWDADGGDYVGGIGFGKFVICGCCGGLFEIEEIYEFASEDVEPIIIYKNWVDISEDIVEE